MTSPLELYLRALDGVTAVVDHVPTAGWDAPSPCSDWSARQLLGHVIDGQRQVVGMLTGQARPPVTDPTELGRLAGPDPRAAWQDYRDAVLAVLSGIDPGAAVTTPGGPSTASAVLSMVVIEPLVHAWDLAIATGQPGTLDPDVVAAILPGVLAMHGGLAATGMYRRATPVPADATPQDWLLAALGRG